MFRIFTFPVAWLPDFQAMLIEISWHGSSGTAVFMKRTFLLLPILLVIAALWNTMLAVYTVPFRHQRGQFLISIVLLWWEVGRSIWLFWVGAARLVLVLVGWVWGVVRLFFEMAFRSLRRLFGSPLRAMDWLGRRYFKPGVPWLAFMILIAWCVLEGIIFTFTLQPTVSEVFWDLSGVPPGMFLMPILFVFLFVLIAGSFASLQVLAEAMEKRDYKQFVQMVLVEAFVMFFEVVFLYRELIDAITPWIAAQTGGQVTLGLIPTLAIASFGWIGIRAMTWFLFGRYGTPALLAVLSRQQISLDIQPPAEAVTPPVEFDWWRAPILALKQEADWFRERGRELLELFSLPALGLLAAAVNCATVVIAGRTAFKLPFKSLDQVLATDRLIQNLSGKPAPAASGD